MRDRLQFDPGGVAGVLTVLALQGLLEWFLGGFLPLLFLIITAAAAGMSVWLLWSRRGHFRAEVRIFGPADARRRLLYSVRVRSDQRFLVFPARVRLLIGNDFTGGKREQTLSCLAEPERVRAEDIPWRSVEVLHYGRISLELAQVQIYDLFHLCCWGGCERVDGQWIMAPAFSGHEDCADVQLITVGMDDQLQDCPDISADYEIREYQPQDSMRNIHWKLSARQGQWMVKERLADGVPRVNVLMSFSDDRAGNDRCMEMLAAQGCGLLNRGIPIGLYWWSDRETALKTAEIHTQEELSDRMQELLCLNARACPKDVEQQYLLACTGVSSLVIRYGQRTGNG